MVTSIQSEPKCTMHAKFDMPETIDVNGLLQPC